MEGSNLKIVDYSKHCPRCKYRDKKDYEDPCNECMTACARYGTKEPLFFERRARNSGKSKS